ncbi:MAG: arginine--tRNA ligase [Bacteroidota bacterium]
MNLEQHLQAAIQQALRQVFGMILPISDIRLQPTRKEFEGSHTFVAFALADRCQQRPEEVANKLGVWVKQHTALVADFNVVKGFLNLLVADSVWLEQLATISQDEYFGYAPPSGQKMVIEFSSPNTNKPLHLGHLRNNFLGYAVAKILQAAGHKVHQVNLVNDRGIHICKSMVAYQRWGQGETPASTGMKGDHLVGKYYVKFEQTYKEQVATPAQELQSKELAAKQAPIWREAQAMLQCWEAGDPAVVALWEKMNSWVYQGFEATYQQLGISFDKTYYESQTYLLGKQVVEEGLANGVFYRREDGAVWVDLADDGLDEKLVLRADGTAVYLTQDMGAADLRYRDYCFAKSIYVVGNEQDYHFEVLTKVLKKLGRAYVYKLAHLSYGMVDLPSGKMKSREGTVVDADSLIDEMLDTAAAHTQELGKVDFSAQEAQRLYHMLAMGALKYFLLRVDAKKRLLFDPKASIDFQGDTGTFIQYTHARITAILRKAQEKEIAINQALDLRTPLQAPERAVIIQLCRFPQQLQEAAEKLAPAVIAQYTLDLAKAYNRLYADLPILHEPEDRQKKLRICISACVARIIQRAMHLLGIEVPERM